MKKLTKKELKRKSGKIVKTCKKTKTNGGKKY
jgi:DNA-directed RNA polymerase subunit H (RpoH/RPB5)